VVGPCWVRPTLSNLGQTWSTLVKVGQNWSTLLKLREMCSGPRLEVLLMWWVPIGSDRLSPGCLILRADTRENLRGKNRVITHLYQIVDTFRGRVHCSHKTLFTYLTESVDKIVHTFITLSTLFRDEFYC
jgi:hypothetical protein